jgi:hypothetical protein
MKKCASCDIELTGSDVQTTDGEYCCDGCAEGGPCACTYADRQPSRSTNGHADPVVTLALLGLPHADDPRSSPPAA